jgi:hypothetical protein
VVGRPSVLSQHLLQPQLIGSIQGELALKAGGHELGDVAVLRDRHSDHRPLRHRGIVLAALQRGGIRSDLYSDEAKEAMTPTEATIWAR